ncbi:MAG TPA: HD domain-containing protein [Candidatus Paceibacterota bacterium]|nr:HD domain-containing protein [Candidatus Paceibacterota bacterium]
MELQALWRKADSLRGCLSHLKTTQGRRRYPVDEDPLALTDPFVSDEAKLLSSKAFRVMDDKTQVFTQPKTPLIRSRKSHVLEVAACSVVASEMLGLNTNLVRAAAIGHDIGHVPFGHQGESWMAKAMNRPEFCHEVMAPIIAQKIERKGQGLNLTFETLEAMMRHSGNTAREGMSQEAWTLRHTDKFTYIFHDVNDIIVRMGYPVREELTALIDEFGSTQRERTTTAIAGLVIESAEAGKVSFEESELGRKFKRLRSLMYEIYPCVTQQKVCYTMEPVLECLRQMKIGDPFLLLALMTDKDAIMLAAEPMKDMQAFRSTAVSEIVPHLKRIGPIDLCDPGLDW